MMNVSRAAIGDAAPIHRGSSIMSADSSPSPPVLDVEGTLSRIGGDQDLFAELAGFLLDDLPPLFKNLRNAVATADAASVRGTAHALKGLVAGCGGVRATHVAQAIENAGQQGDIVHAALLIERLDSELQLLTRELRAYRSSPGGLS
jgi:HPt (histidine-containing phosphotransfer) domain-containing protein